MERLVDGDDLRQQILRSAVQPMEVLEHQNERRQLASRLRQPPQQLTRPQTDQHTVQPLQRSFRWLEAEQVEQQAEIFSIAQNEALQTFVQPARHEGLTIAWRQPECPVHDLDEGPERRLLSVRRAASGQDPRALLDDLSQKFVHEA